MPKKRTVFSESRLWLILILSLVFAVFLADQFHFFEAQELGFVDLRFKLRPAETVHPDIVIVEIDDSSVNRIGHWPWPRSYHASLLEALRAYGPRLVLYDVLFTEASLQPEEDELFVFALRKAGNVIVPFFFRSENPFVAFFPLEPFRNAAHRLGFVNIFPDSDGRVRRIKAFVKTDQGIFYHTSLASFLSLLPDDATRQTLLEALPLERDQSLWINYPGDYHQFTRIPFHRILQDQGSEELRSLFQGKTVVVGATVTGAGDLRPTPFSPAYPGVAIQASALHTLFTGRYLKRIQGFPSLAILLFLGLVVSFLTRKNPPWVALVATLLLTCLYLGWNFLAFTHLRWLVPVFPALLVMGATYIMILFLQYVQIRLEGELLVRELSLAAQIQENFLPRQAPQLPGVEVGFHCQFAKTVGGDLYDWVRLGDRQLGLCVGDVAGKGVPAALYMAKVITEWRSLANGFHSTSDLMRALNLRLLESGMQGIFVTLLYLILDLDSKTVLFSNAGHEPLFVYRKRQGEGAWMRQAGAPPLGIFSNGSYPQESLAIEEGDQLLLISDGVRELRNRRGEEWGLEGVEKALKDSSDSSADALVRKLFETMETFTQGLAAHDDRTVLSVQVKKGGGG